MDTTIIEPPSHVSVLIPACNEEKLLPRCISSVLIARALLPRLITSDIVVVSDSSSDRTQQIGADLLQSSGAVISAEVRTAGTARALAAECAFT
jgi:glycosyltransferase involved in cell wall biosynthesis